MRKKDYEILAASVAKHRGKAEVSRNIAQAENNPELARAHASAMECAEAIAQTFARFASVDKAAFLKACGIE